MLFSLHIGSTEVNQPAFKGQILLTVKKRLPMLATNFFPTPGNAKE
jgi:hypothetical protein